MAIEHFDRFKKEHSKEDLEPNNFFQQKEANKQVEIIGLNGKNLVEKKFDGLEEKIFKIEFLVGFIIPNKEIILAFIWELKERVKTTTPFTTAFDGKNEVNITLTINFSPAIGENNIILDIDIKNITLNISDKCIFKNPEYSDLKNWRFVL